MIPLMVATSGTYMKQLFYKKPQKRLFAEAAVLAISTILLKNVGAIVGCIRMILGIVAK